MNTLSGLLSPPLLAALSGVTLGIGAILFLLARRSAELSLDLGVPLSWAEPPELRLVLYFLIGAIWGTLALVLRLAFAFLSTPSFWAWVLLLAVAIATLGNLAFLYAAAGSLLQAALGSRGRPPFWFFSILSALDGTIMDIGDLVSGVLFRPAPVDSQPRRRSRRSYDDWDWEEEPLPARRNPARRVRRERPPAPRRVLYEEDEATRFSDETDPAYQWDEEPQRARRVAPRPRPAYDLEDELPQYEDESIEADELPRRRAWRFRDGRRTRDIPRERLDMALREYEAALTVPQRERLREMRGLVETIKTGV